MPAFALGLCGFLMVIFLEAAPAADVKKSAPGEVPDAIFKYVERPEPAFRWELKETKTTKAGQIHHLHLVSQVWHEITWEHALFVYEPSQIDHPEHMLLFVTGGRNGRSPNPDEFGLGLGLANL